MYPYPYQEYESSQALTQRLKDQLSRIQSRIHHCPTQRTQVESHEPSTCNKGWCNATLAMVDREGTEALLPVV